MSDSLSADQSLNTSVTGPLGRGDHEDLLLAEADPGNISGREQGTHWAPPDDSSSQEDVQVKAIQGRIDAAARQDLSTAQRPLLRAPDAL